MTHNQKSRIKNNKINTKIKKKDTLKGLSQTLGGNPQIKGITLKVFTMTPKKPNSALRKVAKIKILNKNMPLGMPKIITAYIPGEKHSLSIHNLVLIRPGKTKDLPGVRYKVIRGALDCK